MVDKQNQRTVSACVVEEFYCAIRHGVRHWEFPSKQREFYSGEIDPSLSMSAKGLWLKRCFVCNLADLSDVSQSVFIYLYVVFSQIVVYC